MAQLSIPAQPTMRTVQYADLLGIDYQSNETEISRHRSPQMVNMISDEGGNPVKRFGYRQIGNADYVGFVMLNGEMWGVMKIGQSTYVTKVKIDDTGRLSTDGFTRIILDAHDIGEVKHVLSNQSKLYVLCERAWLSYDPVNKVKERIGFAEGIGYNIYNVGTTSNPVYAMKVLKPADKYIPTVSTMLKPNGVEMVSLPAGTDITGATQGVNILNPFRKVEYCVTTDTAEEVTFIVGGYKKMATDITVEVLDSATFDWVVVDPDDYSVSSPAEVNVRDASGEKPIKAYVTDASFTFDTAPYDSITVDNEPKLVFASDNTIEVPAGVPNVRITFAPANMEEYNGFVELRESTAYTAAVVEELTITLSEDPYSTVEMTITLDGEDYDFMFDVGEPVSTKSGILHVEYDGDKTFVLDQALVCSDSLIADDTLILRAPLTTDVIKSVKYDVLVTKLVGYQGYYREDRKNLLASDAVAVYDSRLFAASGERTFYSRASAFFSMDDNFYFDVDNKVMLYAKTSSALSVITEDVGKDVIYLARGEYNDDLAMPVYSIKASNAGKGAISSKVSGTVNDEPMFLSKSGIYGITTNYYSEKYSISRSGKINRRLLKEPELNKAVGVNYREYMYVAVNGHMYVLDSRHKDASRNGDNSYEGYYFNNLPKVTDMWVVGDYMIFSDGNKLYTWNNDLRKEEQYYENATFDEDKSVWHGHPTKCKWCSAVDSDGYPQYYKVLNKKGTMVTVAPPMQTSCVITIVKDGNQRYYIGRFNGATFALTDSVLDAFTKKKIKKYKRLQFIVENKEPEPFGIVSIVKTFTLGNFAKR